MRKPVLEQLVLRELRMNDLATQKNIAKKLNKSKISVCKVVRKLKDKGLIEDCCRRLEGEYPGLVLGNPPVLATVCRQEWGLPGDYYANRVVASGVRLPLQGERHIVDTSGFLPSGERVAETESTDRFEAPEWIDRYKRFVDGVMGGEVNPDRWDRQIGSLCRVV